MDGDEILSFLGARVILACRNLDKANEAAEDVKKTPPSKYVDYSYFLMLFPLKQPLKLVISY